MNDFGLKLRNAYDLYFSQRLNNFENRLQGSEVARDTLRSLIDGHAPQELAEHLPLDRVRKLYAAIEEDPSAQRGYSKPIVKKAQQLGAPRPDRSPVDIRIFDQGAKTYSDAQAQEAFGAAYYPIETDEVFEIHHRFGTQLRTSRDPTRDEVEIAVGHQLLQGTSLSREIRTAIRRGELLDTAVG